MSQQLRNLCIIPARGGSKRIPRKNIKDFLGKPIIAYSIETALNSNLFDEVMVSTDDNEIANVAKKYGANVPFMRSKEKSNDYAILTDVVEEVIQCYIDQGQTFDYVCCILPTAPLMQIEHIKSAYKKLIHSSFASIRPVVRFTYPIQRALKMTDNEEVSFLYPKYSKTRSQDLEEAYHDAGQFYWSNLLHDTPRNGKCGLIIPELFVQDIDNMDDWSMAECKYEFLKNSKND